MLIILFLLGSIASSDSGSSPQLSASHVSSDDGTRGSPAIGVLLSINGTSFNDTNGNGFQDKGEPGIQGRKIRLLDNHTEVLKVTTDNQGRYIFSDLSPGDYTVSENAVPGWNWTMPDEGSYQVTLTDKKAFHLDFGSIKGPVPLSYKHPIMRFSAKDLSKLKNRYSKTQKVRISPETRALMRASVGEHFSLLDKLQYTPSERNQGYCGDCWVWAGTGVTEIELNTKRGIKDRLSIQYMNSNYNGGRGWSWACCGGDLSLYTDFYNSTGRLIPWSNANAQWQDKYRPCGSGLTSVSASSISTTPSYNIDYIVPQRIPVYEIDKENAIANIKAVLRQNKAIFFAFYLPSDDDWNTFFDYWDYQSESATPIKLDFASGHNWTDNGGGHAVLCVGYDDTDPDNRYWIMLNSWGAFSRRPNGLFRVSMDMDYDSYYRSNYYGDFYALEWSTEEVQFSSIITKPTVTNDGGASLVTSSSSRLNGQVTSIGSENPTVHICWGTTDGGTGSWSHDENLGIRPVGTFSKDISGLASGTDYFYRCYAKNSAGTSWTGSSSKFTTPNNPPGKPSTPIGATSCYTGTTYNYSTYASDADGDQVRYTFDWGDGTISVTDLMSSGTIASSDHAWSSSGQYSIKARATDSKGSDSVWSNQLNVTLSTRISKPMLNNGRGVSAITSKSARLNGEVTSTGNEDPTVRIYWGQRDGKTNSSSWENSLSLGKLGKGTFYGDISGLTPGTKYYYRCYAKNSAGPIWAGSTATFTAIEPDGVGLFRPSTHKFYMDIDGDRIYGTGDVSFSFGSYTDIPVSGDWNGDGRKEVGIFRPSTHKFYLDYNGDHAYGMGDISFSFGSCIDIPISGDWDGNGVDEVGAFRPSTHKFYLDYNGDRAYGMGDISFIFGSCIDIPISGDWNGDGVDEVGAFRPSTHKFYLDYNGDHAYSTDDVSFSFGSYTDIPCSGDWNGDGVDEVGVFRPSTHKFYLDYDGDRAYGTGDLSFSFGMSIDKPLAGRW